MAETFSKNEVIGIVLLASSSWYSRLLDLDGGVSIRADFAGVLLGVFTGVFSRLLDEVLVGVFVSLDGFTGDLVGVFVGLLDSF